MGKKPKTRAGPAPAKQPKTTVGARSNDTSPLFCLRYVDHTSKHSWAFTPSDGDAKRLLDFMHEMAQLSWQEIEQQSSGGHRKHHAQATSSLAHDAQKDIQRRKLDLAFGDEIFRFRLGSKPRLWGFRVGRTFHLVWWDDGHRVYPTDAN